MRRSNDNKDRHSEKEITNTIINTINEISWRFL